jgi:hypothetical protein
MRTLSEPFVRPLLVAGASLTCAPSARRHRVPNSLAAYVSRPELPGSSASLLSPRSAEPLSRRIKAVPPDEDVMALRTKPPAYNEQLQAYTLNFKGRAKLASKKNFQLVDPDDEAGKVLLLFGKVSPRHKGPLVMAVC